MSYYNCPACGTLLAGGPTWRGRKRIIVTDCDRHAWDPDLAEEYERRADIVREAFDRQAEY